MVEVVAVDPVLVDKEDLVSSEGGSGGILAGHVAAVGEGDEEGGSLEGGGGEEEGGFRSVGR